MSIYPNVTQKDLSKLCKLAEQQKNQRALKIKNRILKQTQCEKLAESLSPKTRKLDIINETIEKLGYIIKELNLEIDNIKSLTNSSHFSISMRQNLGSLMTSRYSLKITQDESGQANILGVPFQR